MKFKNIFGREVNKSINKYLVDWDKPCKSKVQSKVKQFFRQHWSTHIVVEEFPVFGTLMRCDLINLTKKIAIETHGMQHDKFVKHFHKTKTGFKNSIKRDLKKHEWLQQNGFELIEIFENEIHFLNEEWLLKKFELEV
jgi:very-short-patch-repair endonuclease